VLHFSGGATDEQVRESAVAVIEEEYDAKLSGAVQDFLYAAMGSYLADIYIPRRTAEDRWSRDFTLYLPVFRYSEWELATDSFAAALNFLTGDRWTISVRRRSQEEPHAAPTMYADQPRIACLLSGGVDSLVGAINLLSRGETVAFVSQHGGGLTPKFQNETFQKLRERYTELCHENQFYVVGPQLNDDRENTMRSRSILFLGLGVAVASALGSDVPLVVPENGLISLNIPLTRTRAGSSSTRTTHPHFIAGVRQVLRELGVSNNIELPYRHNTKGEMLAYAEDQNTLRTILRFTMSCSHPEASRWERTTPGIHCGYCFPCLIRRAAVSAANLEEADVRYTYDVRVNPPEEDSEKHRDLRAVQMALRRDEQADRPSTFRVLEAGPLPPEELSEFAKVYERGMAELKAFLDGNG
jgi:7-cyano-7-deazaguanine synthase in queuosine biosynthesis